MDITVPQNWNELTPWQLSRIALAIFQPYKNKKLQQYALLYYLFIKKPTLKNLLKTSLLFSKVPPSTLKAYTTFLIETGDLTIFINIKGLSAPQPRMTDITINEFSFADTCYYNWSQKKDPKDIDRLVAVLYRKKTKGKRPPFSKDQLSNYARQTAKLSLGEKFAILIAYQGSRELIIKTHKYVFVKGSEKKGYEPFSKIVSNMARTNPQPFGNLYKTQKANVYDFMKMLDEQLQEQRKLEKS